MIVTDLTALPRYNVIYADPPWQYSNKRTGGSMSSGAAQKYETMELVEIYKLLMSVNVSDDAVLFMWATTPLLEDAMAVLTRTPFIYKTMLTWRKIMSLGMGFWFRVQTEHLLVGVQGDVRPFRMQVPNFYQSRVGKHSEKPDYFRRLIEQATKDMPKRNMIELFARECHEGWDCWGNQAYESKQRKLIA